MKTSNKLLLSAASGALIAVATVLMSMKEYVTIVTHTKINGNNIVVEDVRNFNFHKASEQAFFLNHNFKYKLDPHGMDVRIKGESNLLPYVTTKMEANNLHIDISQDQYYEVNVPIEVTIGTRDVDNLYIVIDDYAILTSDIEIPASRIAISSSERSKTYLDVNCDSLKLKMENRSNIDVEGFTVDLVLDLEDDIKLYAADLKCKVIKVTLQDNCLAEVYATDKISGKMMDQALLKCNDSVKLLDVNRTEGAELYKN